MNAILDKDAKSSIPSPNNIYPTVLVQLWFVFGCLILKVFSSSTYPTTNPAPDVLLHRTIEISVMQIGTHLYVTSNFMALQAYML
jgi:hypothetical protein